jgi:alpha-L-fucosidase
MKSFRFLLTSLLVIAFGQMQAQEDVISFQNTIKVEVNDTQEQIIAKAAHVVPTQSQLETLQREFIAFVHFGPNTFTRLEWGTGKEDPKVFDLRELHTDQWCEAMKAAGIRLVVLTVKHHDGFCLWQSRYTKHGIMSTDFQEGKGDVLKELSESCRKYGIQLGIYLSPADLYQMESPDGLYGNESKYTKRTIPREVPGRPFESKIRFEFEVDDYNEYYLNQLYEVLTEYGPVSEVWLDGAHPKRKGDQRYNYAAWRQVIRTLVPRAVVFGREDIRWCGNEEGSTRGTEWNAIPYPNDPSTMNDFKDLTEKDLASNEKLINMQKPYYLHYQPAETNTSIRDGWFYRDDSLQHVRSADEIFDIWERAVGGNTYIMLNIPPNREGRFSDRDVEVLRETGKRIHETYSVDLLKNASGPKEALDHNIYTYITLDKQPQEIVFTTPSPIKFNRIEIGEPIATRGERVVKHAVDAFVDGKWKEITQATNIGFRRILRFPDVTTDKIRLRILDSRLTPAISSFAAYYYNL